MLGNEVKKHIRAQEIAREHGLPCVYVGMCAISRKLNSDLDIISVESGGAALPHQANVSPIQLQQALW